MSALCSPPPLLLLPGAGASLPPAFRCFGSPSPIPLPPAVSFVLTFRLG